MYIQYTFFPNASSEPVQEWCQLGLVDKMSDGYLLNSKGFTQINFNPQQLIYIGGQWVDLSKFPVRLDYLLQKYGKDYFEISCYSVSPKYVELSFVQPSYFSLCYDVRKSVCYCNCMSLSESLLSDLSLINVSLV